MHGSHWGLFYSRRLFSTEEERLLEALGDEPSTRSIVLFALETGMRRGEILKIQRDDIDFSLSALSIPEERRRGGCLPVSSADNHHACQFPV